MNKSNENIQSVESSPVSLEHMQMLLKEILNGNKQHGASLTKLEERISNLENSSNLPDKTVYLNKPKRKIVGQSSDLNAKKSKTLDTRNDASKSDMAITRANQPSLAPASSGNPSYNSPRANQPSTSFLRTNRPSTSRANQPSNKLSSTSSSRANRPSIDVPRTNRQSTSSSRANQPSYVLPSAPSPRANRPSTSSPKANVCNITEVSQPSVHSFNFNLSNDNSISFEDFSDADSVSSQEQFENYMTESETGVDTVETNINLPILGSQQVPNWEPPKEIWEWFLKVSDLELNETQISDLSDNFNAASDVAEHLQPPNLPDSLWQKVKTSKPDLFQHSSLFKIQKTMCLALKPLLSTLASPSLDDSARNNLATTVQLICTANLKISRFRRAMVSKHIRQNLRPNLFSQPVTHSKLFGTDFNTAADNAIKTQSSVNKVLFEPRFDTPNQVHQRAKASRNPSPSISSASRNNTRKPFRGRSSAQRYRGNGSSYKRGGSSRRS